jgi:WD40 repeat protein
MQSPQIRELGGHEARVSSAAFSHDGKRVITASSDATARLWDAKTAEEIRILYAGVPFHLNSVAFSPDDKLIVTASDGPTALIWDAGTGQIIGELTGHTDGVTSAAFSADGKHIVTASRDKSARVWSAATRVSIHTLVGHAEDVTGASFSPDGKHIATASADKTARLFDAVTGEQVGGPFIGHSDTVSGAAFSADGKRIVTASWDKTARLWDNDFRTPIAVMRHPDRVLSAEFSPNGELVITASSDGAAWIWHVFVDTNKLIATARAAAPRCLTAEQREASYFLPAEPPAWCIEMAKWPYQTVAWKAWLADLRAGKNPALPAAPAPSPWWPQTCESQRVGDSKVRHRQGGDRFG